MIYDPVVLWKRRAFGRLSLAAAAVHMHSPPPAYFYKFNRSELIQPLAQLVLESGWTFKPVYTFFRPLGG